MPDLDVIGRFALTTLALELTPGPNMAFLATLAAVRGPKPGLALVGGIAVGLTLVGVASALGLSALIASWPPALPLLTWGGVAFLVWMAVESWREADLPPQEAHAGGVDDARGLAGWFGRGIAINLLNPKAAVFYLAVLPGFATSAAHGLSSVLSLTGLSVAIATAVHCAIVAAAGALQPQLASPASIGPARRIMAVILLGVAAWFAWSAWR